MDTPGPPPSKWKTLVFGLRHGSWKWDKRFYNYQFMTSQSYGWTNSFAFGTFGLVRYALQTRGWGPWQATSLAPLLALGIYILYNYWTIWSIFFFNQKIGARAAASKRDGKGKEIEDDADNEFWDSLDLYVHKPLDYPDSFRLLLLKSGNAPVLECELIDLSNVTHAKYDALSYSWGSPTPQKYILCNGKKLPISPNCEAALRNLRLPLSGRMLWVDAVCIDQSDDNFAEKNQQLRLMGHIYSQATDVIIWLGESNEGSAIAFSYLRLFGALIYLPRFIRTKIEGKLYEKILARGHETAIQDIANRPWFSRVWTLQEAALAQRFHTLFICGKSKISYDWIIHILSSVSKRLNFHSGYHYNAVLSSLLLRTLMRTDLTMRSGSKMMVDVLTCDATDPKDRVYALYEILHRQGILIPEPDYSKTVGKIYWEATVAICNNEHGLDLILLVTNLKDSFQDTPSWVPDLSAASTPRNSANYIFFAATADKADFTFSSDNRKIRTTAAIIDNILEVSTIPTWQPGSSTCRIEDSFFTNLLEGYEQTIWALQTWFFMPFTKGYKSKYNNGTTETNWDAYRETLLFGSPVLSYLKEYFNAWLDLVMCTYPTWREIRLKEFIPDLDSQDPEAYLFPARIQHDPELRGKFYDDPELKHHTHVEEWKILAAAKTIPGVRDVHHQVWMLSRDSVFFVTREGWMGIASLAVREGDVIALIPSLRMPLVLRSVDGEEKGVYTVVASAYVHGIMKGEVWGEWRGKVERVTLI